MYLPEFLKHESARCVRTPRGSWVTRLCGKPRRPWETSLIGLSVCASACFNKPPPLPGRETFFIFAPLNKFNNNPVRRDARRKEDDRRAFFFSISFIGSKKLISLSRGAEPPTPVQPRAGGICLVSATRSFAIPQSPGNVMLPDFDSIPALPLSWFNTVVLIYAPCLLSVGCWLWRDLPPRNTKDRLYRTK